MLAKHLIRSLAAIGLGLGLAQAPSHAAVVYATGSNTSSVPALTGFVTTGDLMDGLSVTATFTNGLSETRLWADTGPGAGGVSGTGWSLSLTGDSFFTSWSFSNTGGGQLDMLVLDGLNAFTIFDRTLPSLGTPGSGAGTDFNCAPLFASVCSSTTVTVTYDYVVSVGGNPAVGDLWQTVSVDFATGPSGSWAFVQDTDNDIRITQVPEPGSLLLLSLALGALGFMRRRRR